MGNSARTNFLWPEINDSASAKKAAQTAAGTAFLVAIVTGVLVYFQLTSKDHFWKTLPHPMWIDSAIFLIVGTGLCFNSRIAAIAALAIYVFGQYEVVRSGMRVSPIMVFFTLHFISGIRGTFGYHEHKKLEEEEAKNSGPISLYKPALSSTDSESTEKSSPTKDRRSLKVMGIVLFILAATASVVFWALRSPGTRTLSVPSAPPGAATLPAQITPAAKDPKSREFHLKDGRVIKGKIVYQDSVYYSVESFGKTETVLKEDIVSIS